MESEARSVVSSLWIVWSLVPSSRRARTYASTAGASSCASRKSTPNSRSSTPAFLA